MTYQGRFRLGGLLIVVVVALTIVALGWRRYLHNRPPAPTDLSLQLAGQMVGAYFQPEGSGFRLPYRLFVPRDLEPGRRYPLVVYLHGAGDNGDDNVRQLGPTVAALIGLSERTQAAFILAPQAPWGRNWVKVPGPPFLNFTLRELPETEAIKATRAMVRQLPARYPIDRDRVYLLGFSAGSAGSWDLLTRTDAHPFAAAAMLSGAYDPTGAAQVASMPLWFFHGDQDTASPYSTTLETVDALRKAGGAPRYSLCEGVGHDTGDAAIRQGVYAWLLGQRRSAWNRSEVPAP
jgi:predicted peptidase